MRNSSYIRGYSIPLKEDKECLRDLMAKVRVNIYSKPMREYLDAFKIEIKVGNFKESKLFSDIYKFLEDSFIKVNKDFSDMNLNPESINVTPEKEGWEKEVNKAKREWMKACTDMYNQNRRKSINLNKQRMMQK